MWLSYTLNTYTRYDSASNLTLVYLVYHWFSFNVTHHMWLSRTSSCSLFTVNRVCSLIHSWAEIDSSRLWWFLNRLRWDCEMIAGDASSGLLLFAFIWPVSICIVMAYSILICQFNQWNVLNCEFWHIGPTYGSKSKHSKLSNAIDKPVNSIWVSCKIAIHRL